MARADVAPEDRDRHPLQLTEVVDCLSCDTPFDVVFTAQDGVFEPEDLTDAPTATVECPECGRSWEAEYTGWQAHEDAG